VEKTAQPWHSSSIIILMNSRIKMWVGHTETNGGEGGSNVSSLWEGKPEGKKTTGKSKISVGG
jgi:hypothetical protein